MVCVSLSLPATILNHNTSTAIDSLAIIKFNSLLLNRCEFFSFSLCHPHSFCVSLFLHVSYKVSHCAEWLTALFAGAGVFSPFRVRDVNCFKAAKWVFASIEHVYSLTIHYVCQLMADGFMFCLLRCYLILANHLERATTNIVNSDVLPIWAPRMASKNKAKRKSTIICTDTYNQIKPSSKSIKDVDSSPCHTDSRHCFIHTHNMNVAHNL